MAGADIFFSEITQNLGWTLVHFAWQGTVIALLLAVALWVLGKATANVRNVISCMALVLMVVAPVATMLTLGGGSVAQIEASETDAVSMTGSEVDIGPAEETAVVEKVESSEHIADLQRMGWKAQVKLGLETALPFIVMGWLVGVFGLSMWRLGGWTQVQLLKHRMVKPVDGQWQLRVEKLAGQLGVRRAVRILESALVEVPTVIGWLRPVILIPACALTGINPQQLEAILLHELAHIRRLDYMVNLLQTVVETLGFYHPAVWWVSHRIRIERENCCDDMAARFLGDKVSYVRALTEMEEMRGRGLKLAVAADGGSLLQRVRRLLGGDLREQSRSVRAPAVLAVLLVLLLVIPTTIALMSGTEEKLEGLSSHAKEIDKADKDKWGAREAIETFVAAALEGDFETAGKFDHPDKLPASQIKDINAMAKGQDLRIMAVVADDWSAMAVSSVIRGDHDRIGPLVFSLVRVVLDGRDNWWVDDIDMETPDGAEAELKQFLEKHPEAKKVARGRIPADIPAKLKAEIEKLYSSDKKERADAIMNLRHGEAVPAIPFLMQMLGSDAEFPLARLLISSRSGITNSCSSEHTFGGEAAETLARIGNTSDELLDLMMHPEWRVRANAIRALGGLKDVRAVDQLLTALANKDEHPEVRGNAALALGSMMAQRGVEPLIAAIEHEDPMVRSAAATALGDLRNTRALPHLIAALKDDDPYVRRSATGSLGHIGGPSVVNPLLRALKDDHRQVREIAASALRCAKDPRVVKSLIVAIGDPYSNVQINAATTLGTLKDLNAVEPLIALLTNDNESLRGAAAAALGELADSRAMEPLITMVLKEDSEIARFRGLEALAKLGHAGATKAFGEHSRHRLGLDQWWHENKEELLRTTVRVETPRVQKSSPPQATEDKTQIRIDFMVAESFVDAKIDWETYVAIKNLMGEVIREDQRDLVGAVLAKYVPSAGEKFEALVDLLISRGYVKIIINPSIEVYDGQSAKIAIKGEKLSGEAENISQKASANGTLSVIPEVQKNKETIQMYINLDLSTPEKKVKTGTMYTVLNKKYSVFPLGGIITPAEKGQSVGSVLLMVKATILDDTSDIVKESTVQVEGDLRLMKHLDSMKESDKKLMKKWDLPEDVLAETSTDKLFLHFIQSGPKSYLLMHSKIETGVQRLLNASSTLHEFYVREDMAEGALQMYREYDLSPEAMSDESIILQYSRNKRPEFTQAIAPDNITRTKIVNISMGIMCADMLMLTPQFLPKLKGYERDFLKIMLDRYERVAELRKKYGEDLFDPALACVPQFCCSLAKNLDEEFYTKLKGIKPTTEAAKKEFIEAIQHYLQN
jgi:HEAT repeat protein/beta-lactamase regulating signal transducer with metallopeptidase domain